MLRLRAAVAREDKEKFKEKNTNEVNKYKNKNKVTMDPR